MLHDSYLRLNRLFFPPTSRLTPRLFPRVLYSPVLSLEKAWTRYKTVQQERRERKKTSELNTGKIALEIPSSPLLSSPEPLLH